MKLTTLKLLTLLFLVGCSKPMDITELNSVQLKVGEKVSYRYKKHSSVGFDAEYAISDQTILKLVAEKTEFDKPSKKGMSGGDSATGYFIFHALKEGEVTVTVKQLYRGELEAEQIIKMVVRS